MNSGRTIFSQIMDFLPTYEFRQCVERYSGNYKIKSFSCWDQFLSMAFAQLTYRESLRDIQACLRAAKQKTYHMGIRGKISRNTLAHANQTRDWRIYADFAQALIRKARQLYANDSFGIELEQTIYALDATTIDLCLSLFPWATFRKNKGAVKLHTLLDLRGNIPTIAFITSWESSRSQHPRQSIHRSRSHLHHGSWLSGLRTSLQDASIGSLLCDTRQEQRQISPALLSEDRQNIRTQIRSESSRCMVITPRKIIPKDSDEFLITTRSKTRNWFS